jgi:hypothetical protein
MDAKFFEQFLRESQQVAMEPAVITRALRTFVGANNAVSQAAMQRLRFEDEPASFSALLEAER